MELGERIKQARLEAGLSQRQLCGDVITRNMLSLIENGSARPSMDTLRYFSQRLEKPIGWFLEEQAVISPNQEAMAAARACWTAGNAAGVVDALSGFQAPDETFENERGLLMYLARLELARQAIDRDRLPYARSLLEQAAGEESIYITPGLRQAGLVLLGQAGETVELDDDAVLLVRAEMALRGDRPERCLTVLMAAQDQNAARWQWLAGQARVRLGEYAGAVPCLTAVEPVYPEAVALLEVCYRELGDFKKAYEYACKGRKDN